MPPTIKLEQATGFGLLMLKAILNGGGGEIVGSSHFLFDSGAQQPPIHRITGEKSS